MATDARWRLVVTPPMSGAWNMACDEALGAALRGELVGGRASFPVVRFFRWDPPAISFGYGQRIAEEVDVEAVRADGIGLVRRLTGGRAVLHAEEITYSVICSERDPVAMGGIIATYLRISAGLAAGLQRLGIPAELARTVEPCDTFRPRQSSTGAQAALPCFGSTSRAEVTVNGRKIIGSAQHRTRGLMLQHGSILLGPKHRDLVEYLRVEAPVRERYRRRLAESTTSLAELREGHCAPEEIIDVLAEGLRETLGIVWTHDDHDAPLSEAELTLIERLAREKYAADWWNFPPQPKERTHVALDG